MHFPFCFWCCFPLKRGHFVLCYSSQSSLMQIRGFHSSCHQPWLRYWKCCIRTLACYDYVKWIREQKDGTYHSVSLSLKFQSKLILIHWSQMVLTFKQMCLNSGYKFFLTGRFLLFIFYLMFLWRKISENKGHSKLLGIPTKSQVNLKTDLMANIYVAVLTTVKIYVSFKINVVCKW